jgi:DNA-binding transcriptional LysR family regulator
MTPTLRQLEMCRALAEARSFTRAAEALRMSQSALSQAIAQMEATMGVALFERTKRSVVVTPGGQRFLVRVESILADLDEAVFDLKTACDPRAGRVDLACLSTVAVRLLPPLVDAFRKTYPGAVVRIRDDDPDGTVARVKSGEVDMALSCMFEDDAGVDFVPVLRDSLRFICRADHPLATRPTIDWSDLAAFDVVALPQGSGLRRVIDRKLLNRNIFRNATFEVAKINSILDIVERSDCVSVLPALALAFPGAARTFHHRPMIAPEIQREIGFILPQKALSATATAFRNTLSASLRHCFDRPYPGVTFEGDDRVASRQRRRHAVREVFEPAS